MFKLYVGSLSGANIYKESSNKEELIEAYNEYAKHNNIFIVDFRDEDGNQINEELKRGSSNTLTD